MLNSGTRVIWLAHGTWSYIMGAGMEGGEQPPQIKLGGGAAPLPILAPSVTPKKWWEVTWPGASHSRTSDHSNSSTSLINLHTRTIIGTNNSLIVLIWLIAMIIKSWENIHRKETIEVLVVHHVHSHPDHDIRGSSHQILPVVQMILI